MITVYLDNTDKPKSASEILMLIRARSNIGTCLDPWIKYTEWCSENKIEATYEYGAINFINAEDALAFRIKFGL